MTISPKQSFYAVIATILTAVIGIGFVMYWANGQLESRSVIIEEKRQISNELDLKTTNAGKLKEQLNELEDIVEVTSDILPDSKSQENIVGELIAIASNRGLTLDTIAFSGGGDTTSPETSQTQRVEGLAGVFSLQIQTSISTDYENVLQFLEDLENNKRQFEVTDISIAPQAQNNLFDASLSIVTYIKP